MLDPSHSVAEAEVHCDASRAAASKDSRKAVTLPISVIVAVRNEAKNLPRCLNSLQGVGEIYVVDSQSTDETTEVAASFGAKVVQFYYSGGWPKKRQWALDTLPLRFNWVLLMDADESLGPDIFAEIQVAIQDVCAEGYYVGLDMFFLGRRLRYSGATFYKLCLFRRGRGRFECRTKNQDSSMCDMEVHEHVLVTGPTRRLTSHLLHHNVDSLDRYIQKHNQYSNWEARVDSDLGSNRDTQLQPALFGTQAQRRRWFRKRFLWIPGSPILFFLYKYILRLGFLDGVPGLIYCALQGIQFFHIKAKIFELKCPPGTVERVGAKLETAKLNHVRN